MSDNIRAGIDVIFKEWVGVDGMSPFMAMKYEEVHVVHGIA